MPDPAHNAAPTLQGIIVKGMERISSRAAIDALGCETKHVGSLMRSLGWHGPSKLRFPDADGKSVVKAGYSRARLPVANENHSETEDATDELPAELERVTRQGLRQLGKVLRHPFDPENWRFELLDRRPCSGRADGHLVCGD
jgi:hypothetical protein